MKRLATFIAIAGMALTPAAAQAQSWNRADHRYVELHLTSNWDTSDGSRILWASCTPWRNNGHFVFEYGEWFGSAWNCRVATHSTFHQMQVRLSGNSALQVTQVS